MTKVRGDILLPPLRTLWDVSLPPPPRPPLPGGLSVDVAIVGAGYTGLWTAYYLKKLDPTCRIVVLEARTVGFGASGRNGGWCSALVPMSLTALSRRYTRPAAIALQQAMFATVDEVGRVITQEGLRADFAKGGRIDLARSAAQLARIRDELDEAAAFGFGSADWRELGAPAAQAICGARGVLGAAYTPHCAALHPGALVRGLAALVEESGVPIYEHSPALALEAGRVRTAAGDVTATFVVRATEAYTARLPGTRRVVAPVYSLMVATEPLSDSIWEQIGLAHRSTFSDARRLIIYGQRTADGRLAFGGRGAPYHWASAIQPRFEDHEPTHEALVDILFDLFPVLATAQITHRWGGPLGVPRDWFSSVGLDHATGMAWAGGYLGDGVATSNLAGRTLADLICGHRTERTSLCWVNHRSPRWVPEPLRFLGINTAARLPGHIDRRESSGHRARLASTVLDRLTGG